MPIESGEASSGRWIHWFEAAAWLMSPSSVAERHPLAPACQLQGHYINIAQEKTGSTLQPLLPLCPVARLLAPMLQNAESWQQPAQDVLQRNQAGWLRISRQQALDVRK
jgi:hypothetical protein